MSIVDNSTVNLLVSLIRMQVSGLYGLSTGFSRLWSSCLGAVGGTGSFPPLLFLPGGTLFLEPIWDLGVVARYPACSDSSGLHERTKSPECLRPSPLVISRGVQVFLASLAQGGVALSHAGKWTAVSDGLGFYQVKPAD